MMVRRVCWKQEGMLLFAPNPTWRKRQWGTKHNDFTIKLSPQTKKGDAPPPPHSLWRTCADKREGHLAAWAITATTSHLSIPRGATHYEPTCQLPTCLFHVSVGAHRSSNSQLVWGRKKKNFEPTVIEYLRKSLIKGWEWEINQKFKS